MNLRLLVVSGIILCLTFGGTWLILDVVKEKQVQELLSAKDTRLDNFNVSQSIAKNMLVDYFSINSQEEYTSVRNKYRKFMSEDLWNDFFLTEDYLLAKKDYSVSVSNIKGKTVSNNSFIFKVELLLSGEQENELVYLVSVENNLIYRIESIV